MLHARLLIDTPTSKIRSATQGFVELNGSCKSIFPLLSPLSNTPCTWWKFKIQELQSSGRSRHWKTIDQGESPVGFYINDITGQCNILDFGLK